MEQKPEYFQIALWAGILFFTALFLYMFTHFIPQKCEAALSLTPKLSNGYDTCWREWVSALSGWAAAAAATITALLLLEQLYEVRKQNDFVMGNLPARLRFLSRNGHSIKLQVENNNRSPVSLIGFKIYRMGFNEVFLHCTDERLTPRFDYSQRVRFRPLPSRFVAAHPVKINGWQDHAASSPKELFTISLYLQDRVPFTGKIRLAAIYQIEGEGRERKAVCSFPKAHEPGGKSV